MNTGLATLFVIITLYLLGGVTIQNIGKKFKVSVVQGNIEQAKKWDQKFAREIMQIYTDLTEDSKEQPALIIWPETATPGSINRDIWLHIKVIDIVRKSGTYLLLGSSQHQKFKKKGRREFSYLNSAFLISPDPKTVTYQRYDKIRLLPFGEYLPLKESIPWSYIHVPEISGYMPGKESKIFSFPISSFGVTICWEDIFPDLFRQFVKKGAWFMVNITNEAWFGKTASPYQFVSMSVFRAVENRVFLVRRANTGVSCIFNPSGRIVKRVSDEKGQDIFVHGVLSGWVTPLENKIFIHYTEIY